MMPPVIVLDGNQRSALAVVRSLGERGIPVIVGESARNSISAVSRYCQDNFIYSSPYEQPDEFLNEVARQSCRYPGSVLMPMTDVTLGEVLKNRERLSRELVIPFANWDAYQNVSDKINLFRQAKELHLYMPETLFSTDFDSTEQLIAEGSKLGFPLVLKTGLSRFKMNGHWLNGSVKYVRNPDDFVRIIDQEPFRSIPFLVQEKIDGPGVGVFLFLDDDRIVARFAHQRVREKPPSGGVSVLCQSIDLPEGLLASSCALLRACQWSGVGMVEYKLDRKTGAFVLMEVNARFWGSLQLAVSAGVDFPYLLYSHAIGEKPSLKGSYSTGLKSRWELGDLDHLWLRFRRSASDSILPVDALSKSRFLKEYLCDFVRPSVRHEVFRLGDPMPFLSELRQYVRNMIQ